MHILMIPSYIRMKESVTSPAQPLRDETHAEGGEHAPDGEDGNGQGPEGGECPWGDGLLVPVHPRSIVVLLDDLLKEGGAHKGGKINTSLNPENFPTGTGSQTICINTE